MHVACVLIRIPSRSVPDNPSSRIVEVRISEVPLYMLSVSSGPLEIQLVCAGMCMYARVCVCEYTCIILASTKSFTNTSTQYSAIVHMHECHATYECAPLSCQACT